MSSVNGNQGVAVVVEHVRKSFESGLIKSLEDVSLRIEPAEFVSLIGPSGSGKSTLLNLIGSLDRPDSGSITVGGHDLAHLRHPSQYRAGVVGFVFQSHNLMPTLNALENVQIPMLDRGVARNAREQRAKDLLAEVGLAHRLHAYAATMLGRGVARKAREQRATELLTEVGLAHRLHAYPATLSGGERQRVAIARALANRPCLLLADEPTGSLDSATGERIMTLLKGLRDQHQMTTFVVTNDLATAAAADRTLRMRDGKVEAVEGPLSSLPATEHAG